MTIYDNGAFDKVHYNKNLNYIQGNFIPNIWYYKVLSSSGKPDSIAITILSELLKQYQNSGFKTCEFQISYSEFKTKFNYSNRQLYDALVRLEKGGLINRAERPIDVKGHNVGNYLFITLIAEKVAAFNNPASNKKNNLLKPNFSNSIQRCVSFNTDKDCDVDSMNTYQKNHLVNHKIKGEVRHV